MIKMNFLTNSLVRKIFVVLLLLSQIFVWAQSGYEIPNPPKKIYPVNDYAGVLNNEQKNQLNQKLIAYADSTSTEIVVCTIKNINGDDINYVGAKWGEKWKIGQKGQNNGVILLLSIEDRKLTIQAGKGTEGGLTDMTSGLIIRNFMVPYLKQGDYYQAINSGTDQIFKALKGEFKADPKKDEGVSDDAIGAFVVIFIVFVVFIILVSKYGNKNSTYSRKGKDDDDFWGNGGGFFGGGFGGFGGGSGGGGFGSGGGFGGFGGGGSFGGGGASGGW